MNYSGYRDMSTSREMPLVYTFAKSVKYLGALPQGAQELPHMAQLADFMRYQVQAAIPAVAVHA